MTKQRESGKRKENAGLLLKLYLLLLFLALLVLLGRAVLSDRGAEGAGTARAAGSAGGGMTLLYAEDERLLLSLDGRSWTDRLECGEVLFSGESLSGNGRTFTQDGEEAEFAKISGTVELRLWVKSRVPGGLYLSEASSVCPAEDPAGKALLRPSSCGFGKDAVCAAARCAFIRGGEEPFVWIPNDESGIRENGDGTLHFGGTVSEAAERGYGYLLPEGMHRYGPADYAAGRAAVGNGGLASAGSNAVRDTARLADFAVRDAVRELTVRLWIESTDRDAREELTGGLCSVSLGFVLSDKAEGRPTAEDVVYDPQRHCLIHEKSGAAVAVGEIVFSLNGISWNSYSPAEKGECHPVIRQGERERKIFIRARESADCLPGPVKELTLPAKN